MSRLPQTTPTQSTGGLRRPSFRLVLALMFTILVTAGMAVTGLLAFRSGQQTAQDMAERLRDEYSNRIEASVAALLSTPGQVNQINADAIARGAVDLTDFAALEQRFGDQLRVFEDLGWVCYGDQEGRYVAYIRFPDRYQVETVEDESLLRVWSVEEDGRRGPLVREREGFQTTARPWYENAVAAGQETWSELYTWFAYGGLCLDRVRPLYDEQGAVVGVLETGFALTHLSEYLVSLEIGRSGESFIVDPQGMIVASSADDAFSENDQGELVRLDARDSANPLVRASALFLEANGTDFGSIRKPMELEFEDPGGTVYLRVTPIRPEVGLDWRVVVAVPERDFMTAVWKQTRATLMLCLLGLLVANLLGLVTVRWISQPLLDLGEKAHRIRGGDLDVQFPVQSSDELGALNQAMAEMVEGIREREIIQEAFGRYVDPDVAAEILREPGAMELGGAERTVTVLMSDLRGFTSLSGRLGPREMVVALNRYLDRMTEVILDHGGTINEFIGDAILVLFGAPREQEDQAERAVRCALAMQAELQVLNREMAAEQRPPLEMGIGIHTGSAVVGNIGGTRRVKYGVVGEAVNLASR
ncbi:MAG: adenylate/guanylate cyclase domain-containing protein, partial [Myxococcota bacterium]|nr:adenylate/guanylate cyclase domain-containing protein [Myxococcota bacterium]